MEAVEASAPRYPHGHVSALYQTDPERSLPDPIHKPFLDSSLALHSIFSINQLPFPLAPQHLKQTKSNATHQTLSAAISQQTMALTVTARPFCSPCSSLLLKTTAKSPTSLLPFLSSPTRVTPRRLIQAAAAEHNKDSSSLEVQQSNRNTPMERTRPRRSSFDISPFGT